MTGEQRRPGTNAPSTRRRFLVGVGAAGVATTLPFAGTVAAGDATIDDELDTTTDDLQDVIVVFRSASAVERLAELDLADGYHAFSTLAMGYTRLTGEQIHEVAGWEEVLFVSANRDLEYFNDDGRETTGADRVQEGDGLDAPYTGENVHVAVIDTGIDGAHPDLEENLEANWQWVGNPLDEPDGVLWEDAGIANTDDNGHGTHCSGTVAGDGTESDGEYTGMAPDATLTAYSANLSLTLVTVVSAYDHMIERKRSGEADVQVVSNSYGLAEDEDYDPRRPGNVATWYSFEADILPVYAAGNSGPETNTLNYYARGPHVLGVAATNADRTVTDFSSRGRSPNYDGETNYDREEAFENHLALYSGDDPDGPLGVYRNGVAAKGGSVMSTLNPAHPLQAIETDDETFYGRLSGTSMACPGVAGCATLVIDAYVENHGEYPDAIDVLNTLEAAAVEDVYDEYTAESVGAGFTDAYAAVERAENGDLAEFDDVSIAPGGE